MANYLINMDDGRIVFRNAESDNHVNMKPISDELVGLIVKGEVQPMDVVNAISAKIKENGDFNLSQYIEDLKKLNVRKSNVQGNPEREELRDRSSEEVSLSDVKSASDKVSAKKARVKKVNEVLDAQGDDMFKDI